MGYDYDISGFYTVKEEKRYPWPCEPQPERDIQVFTDDVLVKKRNNRYDMHTGIYKMGIHIPDEDVIFHEEVRHLRII